MIVCNSGSGVSNMVMRLMFRWQLSCLLTFALCCAAPPATQAQSLIQSFFGNLFSGPQSSNKRSTRPSGRYGSLSGNGSYSTMGRYQSNSRGYYRTVCVRTCDGYYFPIRSAAYRGDFHDDAATCQSRCAGGQLYYLPKYSEDVEHMLDLSGRRYDQLENAFVYRKKLINGCTCRPMPWSANERARHKRYHYQREFRLLAEKREKRLQSQMHAIARRREEETKTAFIEPVRAALARSDSAREGTALMTQDEFLVRDTPLSSELAVSVQGFVPGSLTSKKDSLKPKRLAKRPVVRRRSRRRVRAAKASASPFNSSFIGWKSD
jgi:Protein of unknown function (DUF2865)